MDDSKVRPGMLIKLNDRGLDATKTWAPSGAYTNTRFRVVGRHSNLRHLVRVEVVQGDSNELRSWLGTDMDGQRCLLNYCFIAPASSLFDVEA